MSTITTPTERIALLVDAERQARGLSFEKMAAKTGIPLATLHRSIRGGRAFDTAELERVAEVLGYRSLAALTRKAAA